VGSDARRWALWGLAAYVLAVIVVLLSPVSPGRAVEAITEAVRGLGFPGVRQGWVEFGANIVLFLPFGFLLTLLWRRPWLGVLVAVGVSVAAEVAQTALDGRFATPRDVLANSLGALLGAAIGWAVRRRLVRPASARGSDGPANGGRRGTPADPG
jgi:hypothetical protein